MIFLSITVITGFAGQISLSQGAFAAIGGFAIVQLADRCDVYVLAGLLIGMVIAAAVGALLSLPVLRLGGVWLSLATLAFAFFFDAVMVKFSWVGGQSAPGAACPGRSSVRGTSATTGRSSPWHRLLRARRGDRRVAPRGHDRPRLRALRGSELAAASIGISPARARIIAFAVGLHRRPRWRDAVDAAGARRLRGQLHAVRRAVLARAGRHPQRPHRRGRGLGGGRVLAVPRLHPRQGFNPPDFITDLPVIGRVPSIFPLDPVWRFVLFGLTAIQFARHPEGVLEYGKRRDMARMQARIDAPGPRVRSP